MEYNSDEIPLDIGFSLTGLLPMHCVFRNFDRIKLSFPGTKPHFQFSRTVRILMLRPLL